MRKKMNKIVLDKGLYSLDGYSILDDSNSFKRHFFESWVGYIKFIILFETEKFEKMKAIVRGCIKGAIMKK